MPVYVVTGKLGSGKTLASVGRIRDYLKQGRKVATNLDLNLNYLCGNYAKTPIVYRVPDRPAVNHLDSIGLGYEGEFIGEEKNGALVLDECGTWFNSRDWNAKGRKELLDWVIHARKKRWDVFFIIQDLEVMDKQARLMFAEHVVYCRRSDRFSVPIISPLYKLFTDKPLPLPKVHIGFVKYGDTQNSHVVDKWVYRGSDLYNAYDTSQVFTENSNELYQYLPPFLTHGRYTDKMMDFKNALNNFKVKGFHFFLAGALMAASAVNALVTKLPGEPKKGLIGCNQSYINHYGSCDSPPVLLKNKKLIEQLRSGELSTENVDKVKNGKQKEYKEPLDDVVITGSVKSSDGFDYIFNKNGRSFYAGELGYSVRWVSACKASLTKNKISTYIYCTDEIDFSSTKEITPTI
jgi:zonular occludens toxin Zot